jgi:ECF transporter S component (folate family)
MVKNRKKQIYRLTFAAMMVAMSVVIGIVCKNFFTFLVYYRLTFENLPIILAGYILGPVYGGAVALCADTISCLCSTNPSLNPVISLGAIAVGVISGLVPRLAKKDNAPVLVITVSLAHLIGQVAIKSVGKMIYFGMPWQGIFIGIGFSAIAGALEYFLIRTLTKNRIFKKELDKLL